MFLSIGEAALMLGVSVSTLRRWDREETFQPSFRTCGGHRRYHLAKIEQVFFGKQAKQETLRRTIAYARVSSHSQKDDLSRQSDRLKVFCQQENLDFELISDLGSGLNFSKRGLNRLLEAVCRGAVSQVVLTHRDRLVRFGFPLLERICRIYGTKIVILGDNKASSFEEELAADVIEILTVYTAKLYGRRSHAKSLSARAA